MALRNLYDQANNQYVFSTVDASVFEINNVPISTGGIGTQNLQQVLNTGSDAGNQSITNVNSINMNGYLNLSGQLGQLHLNYPSNTSWQIVAGSDMSLMVQHYTSNNLDNQPLLLDQNGEVFIGNVSSNSPNVFINGAKGQGRIFDTIYNPIPTYSSSAVIYNQRYNIQNLNEIRPVILNGNVNSYFVALQTFQINNYENATHFLCSINNLSYSISNLNVGSINFYLALVSNRATGSTSAITQADLNKNFTVIQYINSSFVNGNTFSVQNFNIEFYDNSGINSLQLVAYTNSFNNSVQFTLNSIDVNLRSDNLGVYSDLPDITTQ